jgi:hypothetical protein
MPTPPETPPSTLLECRTPRRFPLAARSLRRWNGPLMWGNPGGEGGHHGGLDGGGDRALSPGQIGARLVPRLAPPCPHVNLPCCPRVLKPAQVLTGQQGEL